MAARGARAAAGFLNHTSPDGFTERLRGFRQGLNRSAILPSLVAYLRASCLTPVRCVA
jgi:hypothetical protein